MDYKTLNYYDCLEEFKSVPHHIRQAMIGMLLEYKRAKGKYPVWPVDPVKRAAIVQEECGELVRDCNRLDEGTGTKEEVMTEAIQTGAMALRFLTE